MKLWAGRFTKGTQGMVDDFHTSLPFDRRLYRQDILGSIAHATMLGEQSIISQEDAQSIVQGLQDILSDIESGKITLDMEGEDIHMVVETLLTQRIGQSGKRLHTGRSRNDQVALDARMYVKDACTDLRSQIKALCDVLLGIAQEHLHTAMPGYTHMQKAQPITLAHHMMAYVQMFLRDISRFADTFARADVMPLGAGALAGTTYPLNRERVAQLLGFSAITQNSLDAVSDRDFVLDFVYATSTTMMHLSRFCEELILWSTGEFRFATMDDGFSTGSSIMPQKKNPDVAELVRGKTGRVIGDLMGLLTMLKGLPLAYNKDMQEDKESLFDAHDTLNGCLAVFTGMMRTITFHKDIMARGADGGFANATDAADYLVRKGVPFRDCHEIVGRLVLHCEQQGCALLDLTLETLQTFCSRFEADVFEAISLAACIEKRALPGGPAPSAVAHSIQAAQEKLKEV